MSAAAEGSEPGTPAEEVVRRAAARSWRALVISVRAGRPMTLPNLIRLHARRLSVLPSTAEIRDAGRTSTNVLVAAYRRRQPFRAPSRIA